MVSYYSIAGRQVGSHYLSMGVLSLMFGGVGYAMSGSPAKKSDTPSIIKQQSSSDDEFKFIQDFMAQEEKKEKEAPEAALTPRV